MKDAFIVPSKQRPQPKVKEKTSGVCCVFCVLCCALCVVRCVLCVVFCVFCVSQFHVDEVSGGDVTLRIWAFRASSLPPFSTTQNELSGIPLTSQFVDWQPVAWGAVGESGPLEQTPDVSALVQEAIASDGWGEESALGFLVSRAPTDIGVNGRWAGVVVELRLAVGSGQLSKAITR